MLVQNFEGKACVYICRKYSLLWRMCLNRDRYTFRKRVHVSLISLSYTLLNIDGRKFKKKKRLVHSIIHRIKINLFQEYQIIIECARDSKITGNFFFFRM